MQVVLQAIEGPATGTRIVVRPGQIVQVGRTRWADVCIERDAAMADVHFALEFAGQECQIRALDAGRGVAVNEVRVGEARLSPGDSVTAGETTFSVTIEGDEAFSSTALAADTDRDGEEQPSAPLPTAAVYCDYLDLSDDALDLLEDDPSPDEYVNRLIEAELFDDALLFMAFWVPKPATVAWGYRWVNRTFADLLSPEGQAALDAARQWTDDPNEENRRAAGAAAAGVHYDGAPAFVAAAAFWSGGSIAPVDLPKVPPRETSTAQAIAGALTITAHSGDPAKTPDRYRAILADVERPTGSTLPPPPTEAEDEAEG